MQYNNHIEHHEISLNLFSFLFPGRTEAHGCLITGKVIQHWGGMFYPLGHEYKADRFEILVADDSKRLKWVPARGSRNFICLFVFKQSCVWVIPFLHQYNCEVLPGALSFLLPGKMTFLPSSLK